MLIKNGLYDDTFYNEAIKPLLSQSNELVKVEKAKQSVRRLLDFNYNGINDLLIEEVVEKITVYKDWFEWKLVFLNEPINLEVKGKKQDYFYCRA